MPIPLFLSCLFFLNKIYSCSPLMKFLVVHSWNSSQLLSIIPAKTCLSLCTKRYRSCLFFHALWISIRTRESLNHITGLFLLLLTSSFFQCLHMLPILPSPNSWHCTVFQHFLPFLHRVVLKSAPPSKIRFTGHLPKYILSSFLDSLAWNSAFQKCISSKNPNYLYGHHLHSQLFISNSSSWILLFGRVE